MIRSLSLLAAGALIGGGILWLMRGEKSTAKGDVPTNAVGGVKPRIQLPNATTGAGSFAWQPGQAYGLTIPTGTAIGDADQREWGFGLSGFRYSNGYDKNGKPLK